jgi:tetratricopeptide (TPR) repeat protein
MTGRNDPSLETLSTLPTMMQPGALMDQLVGMILKKSRPQLAQAIRLCAVPFGFDLALLAALRQGDDGLDEKILARMARFSFVHQDDRGRYTFGQDVRAYLLNEWFNDRPGFVEANRRAQAHFLGELRETFPDRDAVDALAQAALPARLRPLVEASPQVNELVQNYLHHTLVADPEAGLILLRRLYRAAAEAQRPALAERFVDIANEQRAWLEPGQRAYVDYMRGLLDQLQGKWDASRALFERMLQHEGLPPTLQARIRRALGNTLIEQEQWVEAIALFESALQAFQAAGDELESAFTMVNMGRAHLDLALNTWGGGATFNLRLDWSARVRDLVMLISRLPVAIYLMSRLGVRALLPVLLRVGRDMDWPIARLFAIAADWFDRAHVILLRLGDEDGIGQVEDNLARLYLSLGHHRRAEAIYRGLLAPDEGVSLSEYRAARARLELAQALMHQDKLSEARELLEQTLPLFVAYQHPLRIAQTHTALAQTCALQGQAAQATTHYQRAAQLYHQIQDLKALTDVVVQMQLLQDLPQADAATRQSIETTASQITHRRYLTRFGLPWLYAFRLLALVVLTGALFFSLFTSLQMASGTNLGVDIEPEISWESVSAELESVLDFKLVPKLESEFGVKFSVYPLLIITALYLVLYTVLGLWFTVRTPLRTLQEGQSLDVVVDPEGVGRGVEGLPGSLKIRWEQVAAILLADRNLLRKPIVLFSRFVLFSEQGTLSVDWQTRHASAARDYILERLQKATPSDQDAAPPTYQFGFSTLYSLSGRLFIGTLLFILAFIITSQVAPQVLSTELLSLPYSLADFYSLSYLGLLFPMGWWLAAQPLRERLFLTPESHRVWVVGCIGLLLAAFTFADYTWLRLSFGRPNVAPGLLAIFLVGLAAYYVLTTRHWEHIPFRRGDYVYSPPVRLISVIIALVVIVLSVFFLSREVVIYHYLALGDYHQQRANAVEQDDSDQAQKIYRRALHAYDRALEAHTWGPGYQASAQDADLYHSRGAVLMQLGRYDEAVQSYHEAIDLTPRRTVYYNSLAIAYELWAEKYREAGDGENAAKYYDLALHQYTLLIQRLDEDNSSALVAGYLLRASVLYRTAEYFREVESHDVAASKYQAARADFERALELDPENPNVLIGVGWMEYRLAEYKNDVEGMKHALDYFERAAELDPQNALAWIDQGQAHISIGRSYAWRAGGSVYSACSSSSRNPSTQEQKLAYQQEHLLALEAFDRAAVLVPENLGLYNKRGRVRYVLLNCPGVDNDELYWGAIQDYSRAIELDPENPEWYDLRGHLYYNLGREYYPQVTADFEVALSLQADSGLYLTLGNLYFAQDKMDDATQAYVRAIETAAPDAASGGYVGLEILDQVVQDHPDWSLAYYNRGRLYWQQGENEKAIEDLDRAIELDPNHYNSQWILGWLTYESGDYRRSAQLSGRAAVLNPAEPRVRFNQGLALVALGDARGAARAYEGGIAAAEAMTQTQVALSRYGEALGDLDQVADDPGDIAGILRARLTFKQAFTHLKLDDIDQARIVYEDGIEIVAALADQKTQRTLYDEALGDLRTATGAAATQQQAVASAPLGNKDFEQQVIDTGPASTVAELIALIESARDKADG